MTKGIEFKFHVAFEKVDKQPDGSLLVHMTGHEPIPADMLLFATGRRPHTENLGLETADVALDAKGAIKVDDDNRSSCASIYAVGDVTNRVQLTPVAIREGQAFADTVFGNNPRRVDYGCIPSAVFSHTPMAGVGMTKAEERNKLGTVKVYTYAFRTMTNMLADHHRHAIYKRVVQHENDVLGDKHQNATTTPDTT